MINTYTYTFHIIPPVDNTSGVGQFMVSVLLYCKGGQFHIKFDAYMGGYMYR